MFNQEASKALSHHLSAHLSSPSVSLVTGSIYRTVLAGCFTQIQHEEIYLVLHQKNPPADQNKTTKAKQIAMSQQ